MLDRVRKITKEPVLAGLGGKELMLGRYSLAGIERLVEEEVFVAAYPLHVVS